MGTLLGPKYIPYTYMDPLGNEGDSQSSQLLFETYVSYSLNSLKGGYIGGYIRDYYRGY